MPDSESSPSVAPTPKPLLRIVAIVAVLLMVLSILPAAVAAEGPSGSQVVVPLPRAAPGYTAASPHLPLTTTTGTPRHFIPFVCQFCAWAGSSNNFAAEYQNVSLNITDIAQEGYYLSANLTFASRGYQNSSTLNLSTWAWNNKKGDYPIITACSIPTITQFLATPSLWPAFYARAINASIQGYYQGYVLDFEPNATCGGGYLTTQLGDEYATFAGDFGTALQAATYYGVSLGLELFVTVVPTTTPRSSNPMFWNLNALAPQTGINYYMLEDYTCSLTTFEEYATDAATELGPGRMVLVLSPQGCAGAPAEVADLHQEISWANTSTTGFTWLSYWALDDGPLALPSGLWPSIYGFVEPNTYNLTNSLYKNVPQACKSNPSACMFVDTQYTQWFLENFTFSNIFGVYATVTAGPVALTPTAVTATVFGYDLTFPTPSVTTDPWNDSVNMGQFGPGSVLVVTCTFADGKVTSGTLPLSILWSPPFVMQLLLMSNIITEATQDSGEWNNTYSFSISTDWDLSYALGFGINLQFGGGDYSFIPDATLGVTFTSNADITLSADFKYTSPEIDLGPVSVTISCELNVQGTFNVNTNSGQITWLSGQLTITVSGDASVSYPIFGIDLGPITIGITLNIDVNPSLALEFILAPTTNTAQEFLPGLAAMISQILGTITVPLTISVSLTVAIVSITGGATLTVTAYLTSQSPYILGGTVVGTVFISWEVDFKIVSFSGTLWSATGTLYQWGTVPSSVVTPPLTSNPGPPTRYYNITGYNSADWLADAVSGTLVQDLYPRSHVESATSGTDVLYAYTEDNVSENANDAASLGGVLFNTLTRTESSLVLPEMPGGENFDPEMTTLPNGNVEVIWDWIPNSQNALTNPLDVDSIWLDSSVWNATTHTWGPIVPVTKNGISDNYQVDACPTGAVAADIVTPTLLSNSGDLDLYNLATGTLEASYPVTGIQSLEQYSCARNLAVVRTLAGPWEVLNLSSSGNWTIPTVTGYSPISISLGENGSNEVAVVYQNRTQDEVVVYDLGNDAVLASVDTSPSVNQVQLIKSGGIDYLGVGGMLGTNVYEIGHGVPYLVAEAPAGDQQSFQMAVSGDSLTVSAVDNYGSTSEPLLDLNATVFNLASISQPVATPPVLDVGQELNLSVASATTASGSGVLTWQGLPTGCTSANSTTLDCRPSVPGTYVVTASITDRSGYTATSAATTIVVNPALGAVALSVTNPTVYVGGETNFSATASGGGQPYAYYWTGLPSGCLSADLPTLPCYPSSPGTYSVDVTVKDPSGASSTAATPATLQVNELPTVVKNSTTSGNSNSVTGGGLLALYVLVAVALLTTVVAVIFFFVVMKRSPSAGRSTPSSSAKDDEGEEARHAPGGGSDAEEPKAEPGGAEGAETSAEASPSEPTP